MYSVLPESRNMDPSAKYDTNWAGCVTLVRQVTSLSFHFLSLNMRTLNQLVSKVLSVSTLQ